MGACDVFSELFKTQPRASQRFPAAGSVEMLAPPALPVPSSQPPSTSQPGPGRVLHSTLSLTRDTLGSGTAFPSCLYSSLSSGTFPQSSFAFYSNILKECSAFLIERRLIWLVWSPLDWTRCARSQPQSTETPCLSAGSTCGAQAAYLPLTGDAVFDELIKELSDAAAG